MFSGISVCVELVPGLTVILKVVYLCHALTNFYASLTINCDVP